MPTSISSRFHTVTPLAPCRALPVLELATKAKAASPARKNAQPATASTPQRAPAEGTKAPLSVPGKTPCESKNPLLANHLLCRFKSCYHAFAPFSLGALDFSTLLVSELKANVPHTLVARLPYVCCFLHESSIQVVNHFHASGHSTWTEHRYNTQYTRYHMIPYQVLLLCDTTATTKLRLVQY